MFPMQYFIYFPKFDKDAIVSFEILPFLHRFLASPYPGHRALLKYPDRQSASGQGIQLTHEYCVVSRDQVAVEHRLQGI